MTQKIKKKLSQKISKAKKVHGDSMEMTLNPKKEIFRLSVGGGGGGAISISKYKISINSCVSYPSKQVPI